MLPPGCARLATNPCATGSFTATNTTGIDEVARFIAAVVTEPEEMITSGASATNSAATSRLRSALPPADRNSIRKLRPSVQPNCWSARTKACTRACSSGSVA
jgi:hypothetical protein